MPKVKERKSESGFGNLRPFWSGTIAFGLVSLPVGLFVANRGKSVSLRMVDQDGTPLSRKYFCPAEEKPLTSDEIVRGYEIEKDEFVVVTDEELEALAPEKSQEIDLRRFVPLADIDPVYFERAYFLAPAKGASKAYRLLARAMEDAGRAGIATFVMRGKEYLVAIIAERGILRAETLRFADELRTPDDIGLPTIEETDAKRVKSLTKQMAKLATDRLDRSQLVDWESRRLLELVDRKLKTGEDVVSAPEELAPEEEGEEVVDLMQILKESLQEVTPDAREAAAAGRKRAGRERSAGKGRGSSRAGRADSDQPGEGRVDSRRPAVGGTDSRRRRERYAGLGEKSKAELYEQAKELDIAGRSNMSKEQLIEAISEPR
ncbi:MAG TPA: Ku protein [Trueperaceae bacterium]